MERSANLSFFRERSLPGIEVRKVTDATATGDRYSPDFEFLAPDTWCGEVRHRRVTTRLERGSLLCARPGEVFAVPKVWVAGCHRSLLIDPEHLSAWLDAAHLETFRHDPLPVIRMSAELFGALVRVFTAFEVRDAASELRAGLSAFFALAMGELDAGHDELVPPESTVSDVIERIRRELDAEPCAPTDLGRLAREAGMSRFQLLRAFKRRFGLPPGAYHLRVRLGLAQRALRRGEKPAHVAADYGFFDQAHLARHFRRHVGINPGEYFRLAG
jgi:AraC-like DNA-binding protein